MKKVVALLALGIVSAVLVGRYHQKKAVHMVDEGTPNPAGKNFGLFPPDIPDEQFDGFAL